MIYINELGIIIVRSLIAIFILFITTKILGKKQISQLTIYDYIVGITIGGIAADSIISLNEHFINGMVAILTFSLVAYLISILVLKSTSFNKLLNGSPLFLMEKGEFNYDNLRMSKISIIKFLEEARIKGYYDVSTLDYAVLETNGEISFLAKAEYQYSMPIDFKKTKKEKQMLCDTLIIDGEIQKDVLNDLGKDEAWLKEKLKKLNISNETKILLATINPKGKIKLYKELI